MCKEGKEKREYERSRVSHCHIMLMKRSRTMRYTPNAEFHDSDQSLCLCLCLAWPVKNGLQHLKDKTERNQEGD